MGEGIEKMVEGAKEFAKDVTIGYDAKKENTRNSLMHAGISFGVFLFFNTFVEGSQPIVEMGSLAYAALKGYHAWCDYRSKK